MTPIQQLKFILNENYVSEDGDEYKVEIKNGLTDQEIDQIAERLPTGIIPGDIRELLRFAKGFEFYGMEEISFDGVGQFGFENFFPYSVQLAGDGFGNFWILDIDEKGDWGNVFYVCHDPAVVVKHSNNLSEFIEHVHEFGKKGSDSNLDIIHEKTIMDIWDDDKGFIESSDTSNSTDPILKNFISQLPDNFVVADLRDKPIKSGFAWGKFGPNVEKAIRHKTELMWGLEKPAEKSILSKLFGR